MNFEITENLSDNIQPGDVVIAKDIQSKFAISISPECIPYADAPSIYASEDRADYAETLNNILRGNLTVERIAAAGTVLYFKELPDDPFPSNHFRKISKA